MKGRLLLIASLASRLGVSMGTVLLLARLLPPLQFGLFTTTMSVSYIASLFADFGFVIRALREIGARPETAGTVMTAAIRAKAILSLIVSGIGAAVCIVLPLSENDLIVVIIVWLATFVNSFGDTALVAFRSLRFFNQEVRVTSMSFAFHISIMLAGYFWGLPVLGMACLYLLTRLIYAFAAFRSLAHLCPLVGLLSQDFSDFFKLLRSSANYAMDSILTNIFAQLDGLVVPALLGLQAAGIYQAGSRLAQGLLLFSGILTTYHIPQMSYEHSLGQLRFGKSGLRAITEFGALGLIGAVGFLLGGPIYVSHFLGTSYAGLDYLWPGFAAFVFTRFLASGVGAYLIAHGMSYIRPLCTFLAGCVTMGLYFFLLPSYGAIAIPWAATIGTAVLMLGYTIIALRLPYLAENAQRH